MTNYVIKDANGDITDGTDELDDVTKAAAELVAGTVEDESGGVVYTSHAWRRRQEREEGFQAATVAPELEEES